MIYGYARVSTDAQDLTSQLAQLFRQFLLRGLDKVRGEWSLVTMAWNMKRIFVLNAR
jgi:hypothetical protein